MNQRTINCLDSSAVIIGELEVLRVEPLIEGGHDGGGVVGVLQTQSVSKLVDGDQENIIAFKEKNRKLQKDHSRHILKIKCFQTICYG